MDQQSYSAFFNYVTVSLYLVAVSKNPALSVKLIILSKDRNVPAHSKRYYPPFYYLGCTEHHNTATFSIIPPYSLTTGNSEGHS